MNIIITTTKLITPPTTVPKLINPKKLIAKNETNKSIKAISAPSVIPNKVTVPINIADIIKDSVNPKV